MTHPREAVVAILFSAVLLSIRSVNWNSRKPFLKAFDRVRRGTPVAQVDELMSDYMRGTGALREGVWCFVEASLDGRSGKK